MLGLVNQAIERFVRETYGTGLWCELCARLGLAFDRFEPMLRYPPVLTGQIIDALAAMLARPREELLEDIGTYLVSGEASGAVRRLLRFSGDDFYDFLYSLDDLPARARLAVPELELPELELQQHTEGAFTLRVRSRGGLEGCFGHVMIGLLRAMADDYGALVLLEHAGAREDGEIVAITLLEPAFYSARSFHLGELRR